MQFQITPALIVGVLVRGLFFIPLCAFFLQLAIGFFNRIIARQETGRTVPEPKFWLALRIAGLTYALMVLIDLIMVLAVAFLSRPESEQEGLRIIAQGQLVALLISYFAMAKVVERMLPTTFARALLLSAFEFFLYIVAIAFIFHAKI